MLKTRLIARLDIRNDRLIKPIRLEGVRPVGDPAVYAAKYNDDGIDEILFMDAVASLYGRNNLADLVSRVSEDVFCPMTVGGGIRSVDDARKLFRAGADKIAINTAAIKRPQLISEIADCFGSQAMVLQIDAKRTMTGWEAYTNGGREHTGRNAIEWAIEGVARGAGEILLTSIDQEGTRTGFDLDLITLIAREVNTPIVASGGMGNSQHAIAAIHHGASAVAMADILHLRGVRPCEIATDLLQVGIPVRTPEHYV